MNSRLTSRPARTRLKQQRRQTPGRRGLRLSYGSCFLVWNGHTLSLFDPALSLRRRSGNEAAGHNGGEGGEAGDGSESHIV